MKSALALLAFLLLSWLPSARASAQDGLALMKVESGARPAGMGGAFVSIAGDPVSAIYNPAGAVNSPQFRASFGHNEYWENIRLETGYFSARWSDKLYLHGGIRYAAVSDLESRLTPSSDPDGIFSAHDVSLKGGLAFRAADMLAVGFSAGWFLEKIEAYRGSAFNVDLGALVTPRYGMAIGASVTNLGPSFTLGYSGAEDSEEISLPTTYRVGACYQYRQYRGAADLVAVDDKAHIHLGAEAQLQEYLGLRAGYMTGYDVKDFTAGASFHAVRYNVVLDYGFIPYSGNLGSSHLISLTIAL